MVAVKCLTDLRRSIVGDNWCETSINVSVIVLIGGTLSCIMQITPIMYSSSFDGTALYVWFSTAWLIVMYPLSRLVLLCRRQKNSEMDETRSCNYRNTFQGYSPYDFIRRIFPICVLWFISSYLFLEALTTITATDASAIFSTSSACMGAFAISLFNESLLHLQVISMFLSSFGFLIILYIDGAIFPGLVGVLICISATIGSSFYKVLFYNIVGDASLSSMALFMTMLGVCNLVFLWPIPYLFCYWNQETYLWNDVPWFVFYTSSICTLAFNCLVIFGSSVTSPFNISLGSLICIPINAVVDVLAYEVSFSWMKLLAYLLLSVGYVLMMLPVQRHRRKSVDLHNHGYITT